VAKNPDEINGDAIYRVSTRGGRRREKALYKKASAGKGGCGFQPIENSI
jgi:hypothetical protein